MMYLKNDLVQDCPVYFVPKFKLMVMYVILFAVLLVSSSQAVADWTDKVRIKGFFNGVYQISDESVLFNGDANDAGIDNSGTFRNTNFGLNITAKITNRIRVATQFIAVSQDGNFNTELDWGFLELSLNDNWALKTGKIKFPVGLVNEYVDISYAFPWLVPPRVIYSGQSKGSRATTESYIGAGITWKSNSSGSTQYTVDLFGGEVGQESTPNVKDLFGVSASINWNDVVTLKASTYTRKHLTTSTHSAYILGLKADYKNYIVYSEYASTEVDDFPALDTDAWYITVGYRMGKWLPHFTYESFEQGDNDEQTTITLGVKYELAKSTSLKFSISNVDTDLNNGDGGLFESTPGSDSVNIFGMGIQVVF
ncbi:hypothetical protein MNBD_GAMMA12-932 [hydrothermal vent metagenome]|uniref:Porin domain-containing protein n=1 Tax=hydrothermal vent metagenome TaxID=652676 RepID=A0A3B0YGA7_9ZZZZ